MNEIQCEINNLLENDQQIIDFYNVILNTDPVEERFKIMLDESNNFDEFINIVTTYNKIIILSRVLDKNFVDNIYNTKNVGGLRYVFICSHFTRHKNKYIGNIISGEKKILEYILDKFDPNELLDPEKNILENREWIYIFNKYLELFLKKGLDVNKVYSNCTGKKTIGEEFIEIISLQENFLFIVNYHHTVLDHILWLVENIENTSKIFCSLTTTLLAFRYNSSEKKNDKIVKIIEILLDKNYDDHDSIKKILLSAIFLADYLAINILEKYVTDIKHISEDIDNLLGIEKNIDNCSFEKSLENIGIDKELAIRISSKIIGRVHSEIYWKISHKQDYIFGTIKDISSGKVYR